MGWWLVGLALVLPWVIGTLWIRVAWRDVLSAGGWPLALGYGYLLGMLTVTLFLRLQAVAGFSADFGVPLVALTVLGGAGVWWLWRRGAMTGNSTCSGPFRGQQPSWQRVVFVLLLSWLLWRLTGLALEIWWRPLYPWDAWANWTVRSKVWAELRQWAPFVTPQQWLADPAPVVYTVEAWAYPVTVSLLASWPALAFGGWQETIANLPWLGTALALALGFYGQVRLWGATPLVALLFTWLLLSLPILDTHIALAGYADLWMATAFSLAAIAFFQWVRTADRRQGILALLLALACPLIKLEGTVWLAMFIPALLVVWLRGWPLRVFAGIGIALAVAWWSLGGVAFDVPRLGHFVIRPDLIQVPYLGRFALGYHPGTWGSVWKNFFVLANWHLFWYLVLISLVFAVLKARGARWRRVMAVFIGSCALMLFVLFFCTDAQHWAAQYTSINRVFMHFVPELLFWVFTVWIPVRSVEKLPDPAPTVSYSSAGEHLTV